MKIRSARSAAIVAGLIAVLVVSGCVAAPAPKISATATSTPTGEKVATDLAPFYDQVLAWTSCENGKFQCATATAPMDWTHPATASIQLALIRQPARGKKLGSLLVNPGGPGGSGFDFVKDSVSFAVDSTLQKNYDIVGFDPRGVNKSSAVKCYENPSDMDAFIFSIPADPFGSDAWIAEQRASNAKFAAACAKYTGPLLGFVDTNSAAKDLDLLRATLGDAKLNYLGYSYGTLLGATYAGLFPKNTGHLVLDGALDPSTTSFDVSAAQAVGFENALRAYFTACGKTNSCPFSGSVDNAMASVTKLLANLDAKPLKATDGRLLGSSALFTAIITPLYSKTEWPYLTKLFDDTAKGDPTFAFTLADAYYNRNANGTYANNSTEAFIAINCLDYKPESTADAALHAQAVQLQTLAPTLGRGLAYDTTCSSWPFQSTRNRVEITAAGSAPILVVGTTGDPATPYKWAQALATQLQNGHLVTFHGEGHTAYNKSNSCVNSAVDNFFVSNSVPSSDPEC